MTKRNINKTGDLQRRSERRNAAALNRAITEDRYRPINVRAISPIRTQSMEPGKALVVKANALAAYVWNDERKRLEFAGNGHAVPTFTGMQW